MPSFAQETPAKATGKLNTVSMNVEGGYRYISAYGVPRHAANSLKTSGLKAQPYAFRVNAKPTEVSKAVQWKPGTFFGVALDGVPFLQNVNGAWNGQDLWAVRGTDVDQYGGQKDQDDHYSYVSIPSALVSKDLSHVGYAADGFPIFVSKSNKFTTSYRLKEGQRLKAPEGPGGVYDGTYISDYQFVSRSGVLDRCNGIKIKDKYYIYVLSTEFPQIPLCWRGVPDPSFTKSVAAALPVSEEDADETDESFEAQARKRRLSHR